MEDTRCANCLYNTEIVDRLKNELPEDKVVGELSDVFKVFGDATRIKILWTLFDNEICVYDIVKKTIDKRIHKDYIRKNILREEA